MDATNPFETPGTFKLHRLEYLVGLGVTIALVGWHLRDINWPLFAILLAGIDLIGYLPGAVAYRRAGNRRLHRVFYLLYNGTHSMVTQSAFVGLYVLIAGWQWALLAVPLHLSADRGALGRFLKSILLPYEPRGTVPAYLRMVATLRRASRHHSDEAELARLRAVDAEYR